MSAHQPQSDCPVQSSHVAELVHGSPAVTHEPLTQSRPKQQSSTVTQLSEPTRQEQYPPSHSIQPQQSPLVVHSPATSTQHRFVAGLSRQLR